MSSVKDTFDFAVSQINSGLNGYKFSNDEKLKLYGYYKQATIGKCNTQKPSMFNLVDKAKWEQWNSLGNMSKEDAMLKYSSLYLDIMNNQK